MFQYSKNMKIIERPKQPHTSFQTSTAYRPDNDIRTDAAIVYLPYTTDFKEEYLKSWTDKGYAIQTMYGFRAGDKYVNQYPEEGQTDAGGNLLVPMPGSYYMMPSRHRIGIGEEIVDQAMEYGSTAIIAEEPEFWCRAGYSETFKQEWLEYYGEEWQDPASTIEARYKSERLKGYLEYRLVSAIVQRAAEHDPPVTGMVACHSALSYYAWNIVHPHYQESRIAHLQEVIAQIWTGTARTPCKYEGITAEHTFEFGYLEYSSFVNLYRGTGKRLWFLMDPLEDNPDRSMQDYLANYKKTLVASLMFPETDEYEVMPWPTRIYGRVSDEYATMVGSIVNMLGDMHRQKECEIDSGTQGIAAFIADSMAWQREQPHKSNFDDFYGMTLPVIMKGIPLQVAQLERVIEPDYLSAYKVLLLSYDMMKPVDAAYNIALADWVRTGGVLILLGGTDAYNDLPEWWKCAGFDSPQDHLLSQFEIKPFDKVSLSASAKFTKVLDVPIPDNIIKSGDLNVLDLTYILHLKTFQTLPNRDKYTINLTNFISLNEMIFVKIENSNPNAGYTPYVYGVELMIDGKVYDSFLPGTVGEMCRIVDERGSQLDGSARFGDTDAWWIYGFHVPKCEKAEIVIDMQNAFKVSVSTDSIGGSNKLAYVNENILAVEFQSIDIPVVYDMTAYKADVKSLYTIEDTEHSVIFEKEFGEGSLIFAGISPRYFASSPEAGELLRSIVEYGCEKSDAEYREQGYTKIRRGRYVAVNAFYETAEIKGKYIDVLDPSLPVCIDPFIPPDSQAVLADISEMLADDKPRLLLSSDRVEAIGEDKSSTCVILSGPLKTKGAARFSCGSKKVSFVKAFDSDNNFVQVDYDITDNTMFISYDSLPGGVMINIEWID